MGSSFVITSNRIPELKRRFPQIIQDIVDKTAADVERLAKESMQGPKHGLVYRRGAKNHQASAPGEAPAMDTGTLANSISVEKSEPCVAIVGPHTEYAALLEFGTAHIAARPFMAPAAQKAKVKFLEALSQIEARLK